MSIGSPLLFRPVYQTLVWGGRRLSELRGDVPAGPIGESWEIADHPRGASRVRTGPFQDWTLGDLVKQEEEALLGRCRLRDTFPLMIKLIDARERLSVQVHPDDALASRLKLGSHGKTECWYFLASGGEVFQGTREGVGKEEFQKALQAGQVAGTLHRFVAKEGEIFFLPARTLHALGQGCFLYELQQTSDVTFRVYDWDRLGLDGKPRPLHVEESLATIDFSRTGFGPHLPLGPPVGVVQTLVRCPYFQLDKWRVFSNHEEATGGSFVLVTCLGGKGTLRTVAGEVFLQSLETALIPADGAFLRWESDCPSELLVVRPGAFYLD